MKYFHLIHNSKLQNFLVLFMKTLYADRHFPKVLFSSAVVIISFFFFFLSFFSFSYNFLLKFLQFSIFNNRVLMPYIHTRELFNIAMACLIDEIIQWHTFLWIFTKTYIDDIFQAFCLIFSLSYWKNLWQQIWIMCILIINLRRPTN